MKTKIFISGIVAVIIFFSGMRNVFAQSYTEKTYDFSGKSFKGINVNSAVKVIISQGEFSIKTELDEDLMDKLVLKVSDSILYIYTKNTRVWRNGKVIVYVTNPTFNTLQASGAASIKSKGIITSDYLSIDASGAAVINLSLNVSNLFTDVSGASEINLAGAAASHESKVSGASYFIAPDLETEQTKISVSGAAEAKINGKGKLIATVSGAAELSYKEEPSEKTIKNFSGIVKRNEDIQFTSIVEQADSTTIKVGDVQFAVKENDDSTEISLGNKKLKIDKNGNVELITKRKNRFKGHWSGVDLFMNGYINNKNTMELPAQYKFLGLNTNKSTGISINFIQKSVPLTKNKKFGIVTGLGWQSMNYRFGRDVVLVADSTPVYGYHDSQYNYIKSKLAVSYLNIPLLLEYQTGKKSSQFHVSTGIILGLKIGSHSKVVYDDEGKQKYKIRDDFNLNPFKCDATLRIGWGWFNIFGTYAMNTLFQNNKGPELHPFTVGITLAHF